MFCTKKGVIKKTLLEQYSRPRQNGVNAITIREDDSVIEVRMTNGNNEIIIANRNGRAIRFHEAAVRVMGRTATGVRGITLDNDGQDEVVGMICIKDLETESVMVVSEQGYGKRSEIEDYRKTNRGGKGVKTMNITEKTGKLVTIKSVTDENDLMIINKSGITIRLKVADVRIMGRATQGVRLINLEKRNDQIGSVCKVTTESLEDEVPTEEVEGQIAVDPADIPDTEIPDTPDNTENDENKEDDRLFCGFAFGEDDLVHEEEDDHRDAAVEHRGADVVDEIRHQQTGHSHPDAVDGVDDAGDEAEGQQIPADLLGEVALAAEDKIALDGEIDALADDHGHHVGAEVGQAAVGGVVAEDIPLEGLAEQGDINARPAEIHHRQACKGLRQKLQQQVLEHGDEVGHDDEQTALAHPLGSGGVLCREVIPEIHSLLPFSCFSSALPCGCSARGSSRPPRSPAQGR